MTLRSVLSTAWHLVRHRALADITVLLAAAVTIVLATTLLAAGPQYAGAVSESGLRERLASEPGDQVGLEVSLRAQSNLIADLDGLVASRLDATVGRWLQRTERIAESDSFRSEALPDRHVTALATATLMDEETELVAGRRPDGASSDSAIEVVVPEDAVELIGDVGTRLELSGRDDRVVQVEIVGIFRPTDLDDRIWWRDLLLVDGVIEGTGFTTVGPLVTDRIGFARLGDYRSTLVWRALPDPAEVTAAEFGSMRAAVDDLDDEVAGLEGVGAAQLTTSLDEILRDATATLRATQAAVIVTTIQLAVLALYALGLAAGLLVDGRLVETELIRARGAEPRQLGAVAAVEGILLVAPALAVAPFAASWIVRGVARVGVLAEVGLTLTPRIDVGSFLGAALAGIASVVVLTVPAVRSARTFTGTRAARGRASTVPFAQRTGLDLALLVVALLGLWQLRRLGGPVQDDATGRAGIDPLLVAAPALGLLAGAVLTLRMVPLAGRIAERLVARARTLVPVLGAWQLSRRPGRLARSVLLLVLAVAIGTFAATYGGTWSQSQADQASVAVGADLVVAPDARPSADLQPSFLHDAYGGLDGVEAVSPVLRDRVALPRNRGSAVMVALDATSAADVLTLRDDLVPGQDSRILRQLAAPLDLTGLPLGDATELTATASVEILEGRLREGTISVQFVVEDGDHLLHRLGPVEVAADGSTSEINLSFTDSVKGLAVSAVAPLELIGMDVIMLPASGSGGAVQTPDTTFLLDVEDLRADGEPIAVPEVSWFIPQPRLSSAAATAPQMQQFTPTDNGFTLRGTTGVALTGAGRTTFTVQPEQRAPRRSIPALVTPDYLDALGAEVPTLIQLRVGGTPVPVGIVGVLPVVAGFPDEDLGILVDLGTLSTYRYVTDGSLTSATDWMLAVEDGKTAELTETLGSPPYASASIQSRASVTRSLRTDPVAVGLIGALTLGFGAAAAFAAVGYLVSAVVAARERLGEFALLRALGTSHRETRRWLTLESSSTVLVSLGGGVALGLGLAWLILPSVSLARDGGVAVPEPVVVIPWATILLVVLGAAVILLAVPLVVTRMLARTQVAEVLRLGDEG